MTMTYNSLVLQIKSYLNRSDADTLAQIPNFIYLAHDRISTECENLGLEQYVNSEFIGGAIDGGSVIQKPGRWRKTISFTFGDGPGNNTVNILDERSYEYLRMYWPDPSQTGKPKFYADYGFSHWLVAPTPLFSLPFQVAYLEQPVPLTINTQTNWLTNYAPGLLLYACLMEAIPYLKDDERIPVWVNEYTKRVEILNRQDKSRVYDRISNRTAD